MVRAKYSKTRDFFYNLSPWILAAACVLLFFVLTLFAFNNYQREKKLVIDALTQKGVTILRFINSSSRESMRANFRGAQDLLPWEEHAQVAIEQAAEQPGVDYVVLVDIQNQIIAGAGVKFSEKKVSGTDISFFSSLRVNQPDSIVLRTVEDEEGERRSFQVAGLFQSPRGSGPFPGMGMRPGGRRMKMHKTGRQPMFAHFKGEINRLTRAHPVLIVQLNLEQFSSPVKRQVLQMVILFVVFILVAVGSFLSLLTLRGLKGSRVHLGRVEKELQRSERLAALGKMAAGVAHELRNPLSSIKGLAILLKSKFTGEEEGIEAATLLVQEVTRLNRSIEELLDYAKPAKLNKVTVDVNAIVKKTALLVEIDLEAQNISLDLNLTETLPAIEADDDKLNQVFLNLFLNGIQAMDSGGILTVSSHLKGKSVVVVVEDTGSGIADENQQKVFDPYFTTKSDGTGLGLALSAKIIEEHEGKIVLSSRPGEGTRVEVVLPIQAG
jgi:signal transduction histidine kinase